MKIFSFVLSFFLLCLSFVSYADNVNSGLTADNQESIWVYKVNQNDSFERIYQKYLSKRASIAALSKYNNHPLGKKLQPNQVINIPVEMLKKLPTTAQVLLVYGEVNVTNAVGVESRKVKKGDLLAQGDTLQTGKNSLAKLLFADGSNIDIQPNSNLSIQASYKYAGKETYVTHLKLVKGRTEVSANPQHIEGNSLQIQTPSAIAAVRGTQFRVGADDNIALQETLEGKVAFSAGGQEILLAKGYGSVAEKDKAPLPPIQLPNAPDASMLPNLIEVKAAEFDLPAQTGVVALVGQLALDADFTQILNEQTSQTGKLAFADLPDGQYFLKLRAQDEHGLQSLDALHRFDVKYREPEPQLELIEPVDGAEIPLAPTDFSWMSIPGAMSYVVQIARDAKFESKVFERHASFNRLTVNQSFGTGEYYWRVAELKNGKPQKFSNVRKFTR